MQWNLGRDLVRTAKEIREGFGKLHPIVGALRELVLPSDDELRKIAELSFDNARIDLFEIPFSIDSAKSSLEKCIQSLPPSGPGNQQFKDGVIWADCCQLAAQGPVHFVSMDKGFFKDRDYKKGLTENLEAESKSTNYGVSISSELKSVLALVRAEIPIDFDHLENAFLQVILEVELTALEREGFIRGSRKAVEHQLFATDDPATAYLEFALEFECLGPNNRVGRFTARGEGRFTPSTNSIDQLRSRGSEFVFENEEGQQVRRNAVVMAGCAHLGHRLVPHEVKMLIQASKTSIIDI